MVINMMTFNKRENSTARPNLDNASTLTGQLRDSCSIITPTIGLAGSQDRWPTGNYAYIPEFDRYYWITNWTWDAGIWWADMRVDVLASWRTTIGNSTQYVLRAAAGYNGDIIDSYYPMTAAHSFQYNLIVDTWDARSPGQGWYVVGIVSKAVNAIGATAYYVFTPAEFRTLMSAMLSSANWTQMDFTSGEISEAFFKSIFNPFQYVVSCMWLPLAPPMSADEVTTIPLGWWDLSCNAHMLTGSYIVKNNTVAVPKHPKASARGAYLNCAPYTRLKLMYEPFGLVELDSTLFSKAANCYVSVLVDAVTGVGRLSVGAGESVDLDVVSNAQVGVPIQLAQISQDLVGAASKGVGGIAGAVGNVVKGNIGDAIMNAVTGIVDAAVSLMPHVSMAGMNGSFSGYTQAVFLAADCWDVVDDDRARRGRPLCGAYQLSGLAGYQMILDPDLRINGTDEENRQIKEYLMNGYFWE